MVDAEGLTPKERQRYEWQLWSPLLGESGQRLLKQKSVLISRIGGVGGNVALHLAAAGIGRLFLAHAGEIRLDDLNRQILMTTSAIGQPRVNSAREKLTALNPEVELHTFDENITEQNVASLVEACDIVVSAAPLFTERLLLNREAVRQRKPLVDCSMYDFEGRLLTVIPGKTACLACLYPELPPNWKREFPVLGAVAATIGSLAAVEVVKLAANIPRTLAGQLLLCNLHEMQFRKIDLQRRVDCAICVPS
jgi:molybdopterin/thiamine biosynthesis adenylyltransferase